MLCPGECSGLLYTPPLLRGAALLVEVCLRNEGGNVGTSLAQTMQERRDQFHTLRWRVPRSSHPAVVLSSSRLGSVLQQTADPVAAQQLAWQALENLRQQQASATCLFRCLFDVGHGDAGAGTRGAADETFGGLRKAFTSVTNEVCCVLAGKG